MPIVDVDIVALTPGTRPGLARTIADEVGKIFGAPPGRTWVRLRAIDAEAYAESGTDLGSDELPVFVEVLHRVPPEGAALQAEIAALTETIARILDRPPERVHVRYAPAALGRQAFGGRLVL